MKKELLYLPYEWLEIKKLHIKYSSYCKYEMLINKYINPFLNQYHIETITELDIIHFLDDLINNKCLASSTIKSIKDILHSIYEYGESKYSLRHINFSLIKFTKKRAKQKQPLNIEDQIKLYQYCIEHNTNIAMAILLGLYCGLRVGEVCGLTWNDIDLDNEIVHVNKTVLRLKNNDTHNKSKTKLMISDPKTNTSNRDVIVPHFAFIYLEQYYKSYDVCEATKHRYILNNKEKPLDPRSVQKRLQTLCQTYEINCSFHTLRHTYATNCIEKHMDIKTVSEILGHASVSITLDKYVHPSFEYKKQEINKIKAPINI
jgi:integrase